MVAILCSEGTTKNKKRQMSITGWLTIQDHHLSDSQCQELVKCKKINVFWLTATNASALYKYENWSQVHFWLKKFIYIPTAPKSLTYLKSQRLFQVNKACYKNNYEIHTMRFLQARVGSVVTDSVGSGFFPLFAEIQARSRPANKIKLIDVNILKIRQNFLYVQKR